MRFRKNIFWNVLSLLFIFVLMMGYQNCDQSKETKRLNIEKSNPDPENNENNDNNDDNDDDDDDDDENDDDDNSNPLKAMSKSSLPLFLPPGAVENTYTFARIINFSNRSGTISLTVFKDDGSELGIRSLNLGAGETVSFDSETLINGSTSLNWEALSGAGQSFLRLKINPSGLDILPKVYSRGIVGIPGLHESKAIDLKTIGSHPENHPYLIPITTFNPASNTVNKSELRLVNPGSEGVSIKIKEIKDRNGQSPGTEEVTFVLPAGQSKVLTAQQLEEGDNSITGNFGDGEEKWRFSIYSSSPIQAMNLMRRQVNDENEVIFTLDQEWDDSSDIRVLNKTSLPLFLPVGVVENTHTFARITNSSALSKTVALAVFKDDGSELGTQSLTIEAGRTVSFNSSDLVNGNSTLNWEALSGADQGFLRLKISNSLGIFSKVYSGSVGGIFSLGATKGVVNTRTGNYPYLTPVHIFNPASNDINRSELRLVNINEFSVNVKIKAVDKTGTSPGTDVTFTLPAKQSKVLTAQQLEEGDSSITGNFGDGEAKWRLSVQSSFPIQVMNLMRKQVDDDNEVIFSMK